MKKGLGFKVTFENEEVNEQIQETIAHFQYTYLLAELKKLPLDAREVIYKEILKQLEEDSNRTEQ